MPPPSEDERSRNKNTQLCSEYRVEPTADLTVTYPQTPPVGALDETRVGHDVLPEERHHALLEQHRFVLTFRGRDHRVRRGKSQRWVQDATHEWVRAVHTTLSCSARITKSTEGRSRVQDKQPRQKIPFHTVKSYLDEIPYFVVLGDDVNNKKCVPQAEKMIPVGRHGYTRHTPGSRRAPGTVPGTNIKRYVDWRGITMGWPRHKDRPSHKIIVALHSCEETRNQYAPVLHHSPQIPFDPTELNNYGRTKKVGVGVGKRQPDFVAFCLTIINVALRFCAR